MASKPASSTAGRAGRHSAHVRCRHEGQILPAHRAGSSILAPSQEWKILRIALERDEIRLNRHACACHHKSGLPDLWLLIVRNSGKPEFRWHPRFKWRAKSKTWMAGTSPAM